MNKEKDAICLQGLTKSFKGNTAVDHLTFTVPESGCFALLGINGAGKTTTIRMLSGLLKPDEGDARLLGYSITDEPQQVKRLIGVSMQETAIAPNLTVLENLQLMAALTVQDRTQQTIRVQQCLEQLSLTAHAEKRAKTLSGGWQRRLSIAMALIGQPRILFLDEPTLGLDILARRELWEVIRVLKQQITVVLTTHYMEEVEALADQVAILAHGHLRAMGTVQQLCERSGSPSLEEAFLVYVQEVKR